MQITISKTGRVRIKTGKFRYENKITLGELLAVLIDIAILFAIYHVS